jgi:hypothetical protein
MKFADVVSLLSDTGNRPYVLEGARQSTKVVVSPSLVGRVMASTASGDGGNVVGWINREAIEKGMVDPVFNNVGGEERFWFAPEGGQFGLCMGRHIASMEHYDVPEAFTSQPFDVLSDDNRSIAMRSVMRFENASGTSFAMEVTRTVSILDACPYILGCGDGVDFVGFQTDNVSRNVDSKPVGRAGGAVAMFCLTQFVTRPRLIAIVPFRRGPEKQLGRPLRWEYFELHPVLKERGGLPQGYMQIDKDVALFRIDGKEPGKVGVGRERAVTRLASIDLDLNQLTIMDFDFYPELEYVAGYWKHLEKPYEGDVMSLSYGEGSYELENLSPALFLEPGQCFAHRSRVFHIYAPPRTLDQVCRKFLHVSMEALERFCGQV